MNNGFPPIAQDSPTSAFESIMHDLYLCARRVEGEEQWTRVQEKLGGNESVCIYTHIYIYTEEKEKGEGEGR